MTIDEQTVPSMQAEPISEPRGITIFDLLVAPLGFAGLWGLLSIGGRFEPGYAIIWSVLGVPFIGLLVIVTRQSRYRRPLADAEWVTLLAAALLLSWVLPSVDTTIDVIRPAPAGHVAVHWSLWRWSLAFVVACVCGLMTLGVRNRSPGGFRTVILTVTFAFFHWVPMTVFREYLDFVSWCVTIDAPWSIGDALWVEAQRIVRRTPLTFCVLGCVALNWRSFRTQRRTWVWTCWFSFAIACVLALGLLSSELVDVYSATGVWRVAWLVRPVWLAIVGFLVVKMLKRRERHRPPIDPTDTIAPCMT